ncbi:hypothetical protein BTH42_14335 [Burkholderia sp. SRS-W-2-2016]|uniref:OB-fold-containig protein n=1 Tax=Burkholderia sp. SRS-W-2-2016 TaxID=1926878 RepID=UPI00094AC42A|nr:OB-fold-containig protein [Burkholderia sp. SRS-W-2-2016]OLL30951.1 hypothetical protein BTH42_14335 [Burkholderia sp. SRS-W-2-2016]
MSLLLLPGQAPFVAALGLMIMIGIVEVVALLFGLSITEHAGNLLVSHFGIDHAEVNADLNVVGQFLSWLHLGRVPLLILLILFLLGFSVVGLLLQSLLYLLAGIQLPAALAIIAATFGSLPFIRFSGGVIARYLPPIESFAVSETDFVGLPAQIVTGEASVGNPAEARLRDRFGRTHYIRVEPDRADQILARGTTVAIVSRVSGSLYRAVAIAVPDPQ